MAHRDQVRHLPPLGLILLASLAVFWGINWPAMKIILSEMTVWWFRSICLIVGSSGLLALAVISKQAVRVPRAEWAPLFLCAVLNVIGWHLCTGYGVSQMPAGRAAIIAFTMPVWAAGLSSLFLGEPITRRKLVSLSSGMVGLAVLIGPDLIAVRQAPIGAFFMLMAAVSWACGTVAFKRFSWSASTLGLAGWQLLIGAVPITLGAMMLETPPELSRFSTPALYSFAYLLLFPMIYCQWAYFKVVRLFPATVAAVGTLPVPLIGVLSSAVVLGEAIGLQEVAALVLISAALGGVLLAPAQGTAP